MKKSFIFLFFLFVLAHNSLSQCAMCRATLENNISNGNPGIAIGINFGIMYLFFAPYIAIGVIAFFWYKTSKSNARKHLAEGTTIG